MLLKFSRKTYQTLQAREEYVTYFLIEFRYSPCSKTKQTHGLMETFFFLIKRTKNWWKWNYKLASFWSVWSEDLFYVRYYLRRQEIFPSRLFFREKLLVNLSYSPAHSEIIFMIKTVRRLEPKKNIFKRGWVYTLIDRRNYRVQRSKK